jgi:DNA-binding transcriptional regulator GbsR (MarR family)
MTETTELSETERKFILHWGEMGARWGVNRTVAQVHALLFMSARPLHAEEIQAVLGVARSNVSTSLRELQGWRIVRMVHVAGDRRDHFECIRDVWEMFRTIAEERKRRELDPTLAVLGECLSELDHGKVARPGVRDRLAELHGFFATADAFHGEVRQWPTGALVKLARTAGKARKLLGLGP